VTPVFPLSQAYLPGDTVVLRVFEPRYLALFDELQDSHATSFVTVLIERGREVGGGDRRFGLGVTVRLESVDTSDGMLLVHGRADDPVHLTRWLDDDPYPRAETTMVDYPEPSGAVLSDAASGLTLLGQSVRSLLARHGVDPENGPAHLLAPLQTVASGRWYSGTPGMAGVQHAFWAVARCVPCGPLDRHLFLRPDELPDRVRAMRRVIEHTDEVLRFSSERGS
jgi:hypothetical protein